MQPSITGAPCSSRYPVEANFSSWLSLVAKRRDTSSWPAASMLTQKRSDWRTACSVRELVSKQTSASGGVSDSDVNAFAVAPAGPSAASAVTTLTPVAQKPISRRKSAASSAPPPRNAGRRPAPGRHGAGSGRSREPAPRRQPSRRL